MPSSIARALAKMLSEQGKSCFLRSASSSGVATMLTLLSGWDIFRWISWSRRMLY
jgi:hypothetical protein